MANVTSKVKSHKNVSTRKHSSPKSTPSSVNKDVEFVTVRKRPSNIKVMTPDEKVQLLLQKGCSVAKHFQITTPKEQKKIDKDALAITKASLISKSGRIKKKCIDNMRLFDNILKSELKIDDSKKKKPNINKTNNNENGISNHNITKAPPLNYTCSPFWIGIKAKDVKRNRSKQNLCPGKKDEGNPINLDQPSDEIDLFSKDIFVCDKCGKICPSKAHIRNHIFAHLNVKPYKCSHCPRQFRYHYKMQLHIAKDHNEVDDSLDSYTCDICDQTFLLKDSFTVHLATHVYNEYPYKCVFCNEKFPRYRMLTCHEQQHLVNGLYQCTICKMTYSCRKYLASHIKRHLKIKEFMCQFCGKDFLRQNSMQRHVQVCHGGHRIQCPICKKSLKGHLTEHMRTHEKKRPHKCPECGQRFTQSTQLNVHRRAHTGARPYPCKICNRKFSYSNGLMLHLRRHTGEKPFRCAMCPLTFSQLPHMKAHMQRIHGKANAYKCKKCSMFFKLKAHLENHLKNCTVGDKELSFEEKIQASVQFEEVQVETVMSLSRMRYLLALLLTMIASKEKLKYLAILVKVSQASPGVSSLVMLL